MGKSFVFIPERLDRQWEVFSIFVLVAFCFLWGNWHFINPFFVLILILQLNKMTLSWCSIRFLEALGRLLGGIRKMLYRYGNTLNFFDIKLNWSSFIVPLYISLLSLLLKLYLLTLALFSFFEWKMSFLVKQRDICPFFLFCLSINFCFL